MKPIYYISGYAGSLLLATPKPLGAGAPIPERELTSGRHGQSKLPQLPWSMAKHGLDPNVVNQEESEQ